MRIGRCPLGATDCAFDTCDLCIEELLNAVEEKQRLLIKQQEDNLTLQKQVAKQHKIIKEQEVKLEKNKRQLLGHRKTIENLHKRLGDRDESFKGNEFENKNSYKGWKGNL